MESSFSDARNVMHNLEMTVGLRNILIGSIHSVLA